MTPDIRWLVGFVCFLLAVCVGLMGALIWANSTRPAYTVESCVEVQVKRGTP